MIKAIVLRNKKASLISQFEAINKYPSPESHVKNFKCPALFISGSQDPLVNPKEAKELADLFGRRHEEIPDIGHSIPAEAPELFNKLVLNFLT